MSSLHLPALHMSHIISNDGPLTSPVSDSLPVPWERDSALAALYDPFSLPVSPSPSAVMSGALPDTRKVLKGRTSPDVPSEQCLPTHQVFDFVPGSTPVPEQMSSAVSTPESSPQFAPQPLPHRSGSVSADSSSSPTPSAGSVVVPAKRPSVTLTTSTKKARSGERTSTKDFVPPDVTGLSKREARLVKNRAAAFLSRQRKREEFESMEIRVAELEQENARLLASVQQQQTGTPAVDGGLMSELEQLRRQLADTQQRERELAEKLSSVPTVVPAKGPNPVKLEMVEPELPVSLRAHKGERSGASLGLMVLLCALPTLLSVPTHNTMPNSMSFNSASHAHSHSHSSSLDMTAFSTGDYDWGFGLGSGAMDLDLVPSTLASGESSKPEFKKLEFVDVDAEKLGLSGLDISFDASAAKDGRIRVRIHPPSDSSSSEQAQTKELDEDQTMWHDAEDDLGPFLGVGTDFDQASFGSNSLHPLDFAFPPSSSSGYSAAPSPSLVSSPTSAGAFFSSAPSPSQLSNEYEFDLGSEYGSAGSGISRAGSPGVGSGSGKRRVRIALRGMPGKGKEGGEWEVEVC